MEPAVPWSGSTATFAHAELWTQSEVCPDSALPPRVVCTIAVDHDGTWFAMPAVTCKQVHGSGTIDDLHVERVTHSDDHDVFDFTVDGTMLSMDSDHAGGHVDSTYPRNTSYVTICGIGRSKVPSCTPAFAVAAHDVGGKLQRAIWKLSGDVLTLQGFDESSESVDPDVPKGSFRIVFP